MPLLGLSNVEKDWGDEPIFSGLNLKIEEGEKIGLIGLNGSGKTSLLGILAGSDEDFKGRVVRRPGLAIALVPQRFEPPESLSCVEVLLEGAAAMRKRLATLEEALSSSLEDRAETRWIEECGELSVRYEAMGGAMAEEGARRLLARAGLGATADSPARSLSGGEKNVLALARALALAPDLLLLDEPGNHLDFAGLAWLEEFIKGERRAVLLVSHNRSLLDRAADRIVELEAWRATEYAGGGEALRRLAQDGRRLLRRGKQGGLCPAGPRLPQSLRRQGPLRGRGLRPPRRREGRPRRPERLGQDQLPPRPRRARPLRAGEPLGQRRSHPRRPEHGDRLLRAGAGTLRGREDRGRRVSRPRGQERRGLSAPAPLPLRPLDTWGRRRPALGRGAQPTADREGGLPRRQLPRARRADQPSRHRVARGP